MKKLTVALDGPAGSGKSTVAKTVAKRLGYVYIDTGAMYRAAAIKAKRHSISPTDEEKLAGLMKNTDVVLEPDGDGLKVILDGEDVTKLLRTEEAGMAASTYSKSPAVRSRLVELQRRMGREGGVVMEGRDIGTVVFPEAEVKYFVTASLEVRAARRANDLRAQGKTITDAEVMEQVKARDEQDRTRDIAPLVAAADAIQLDTSNLTLDQVVDEVVRQVTKGVSRRNVPEGNNIFPKQRGVMDEKEMKNQATQPEPGSNKPANQVASAAEASATTQTGDDHFDDDQGSEEAEKVEKKSDGPSFQDLFEDSIRQPEDGEIFKGTVVKVGKEVVMVDIGYKSEGQISINEFLDEDGNPNVKPGDKIDVILDGRDDDSGIQKLSKQKADKYKVWDELEKAQTGNSVVKGKITKKIKGGMAVDIGVEAFLPGSQVDLRPTRNLDQFVGMVGEFRILKFNRRRGNVVVSRRVVLEEDRNSKRSDTLKNLEKGRILTGVVKNIVDYGAFIDLGGIDGLLHVTDMSWGRVKHPSDMIKPGQEIKVCVLKYDQDTERVSLGLKQITPDPWDTIPDKFPVGSRVKGKVVSVTDYGAFVELEAGVEGLIHVSEMSWTKRVKHPSKIVQVGQETEVMVLDIDMQNRRVSLGLKQVEPNPWDIAADKFPSGTVIRGRIRNITDFGVFIGVMDGIDGLVHISDMSWTKRIKHPSELYKKGQEVEAVVLNIDKTNERFSLGVKQLASDPWVNLRSRMRPGDTIKGKVVNVTDFGVFLELEEGIEGLIHVSELGTEKSKAPAEHFKAGDELTVEILNIDPNERKIRLSLKALEMKAEQEDMKQYATGRGNPTAKIADIIRAAQAAKAEDGKPESEDELKAEIDSGDEQKDS